MPDTPDLPACKLCNSAPSSGPSLYRGAHWARCGNSKCIMAHPPMSQDEWRALMAPPPEESHLLRTLADMREALGVGAKPMLDELPGLVRAVKAERDELARALLSGPHHCACPKFRNTTSGQERLPHFPGCPVALAEEVLKAEGK